MYDMYDIQICKNCNKSFVGIVGICYDCKNETKIKNDLKVELTKEDLWKLRQKVTLCSIYVSDYENSFDFDASLLFNFFEGYADDLEETMKEVLETDSVNFFDLLDEYDNEENLWNYYSSLECEVVKLLFVKVENENE